MNTLTFDRHKYIYWSKPLNPFILHDWCHESESQIRNDEDQQLLYQFMTLFYTTSFSECSLSSVCKLYSRDINLFYFDKQLKSTPFHTYIHTHLITFFKIVNLFSWSRHPCLFSVKLIISCETMHVLLSLICTICLPTFL